MLHLVPGPHCPPVMPQTQKPNVQVSARFASHVWHAPPARPQFIVDTMFSHVPLLQQPIAQFCGLQLVHWPFIHMPLPQLTHARPPVPQAVEPVVLTHTSPLQQPFGQLNALQVHWPLKQRLPVGHGAFVPQAHWPFASQLSDVPCAQAVHALPAVPHAPVER
jgi:hypothetical protein